MIDWIKPDVVGINSPTCGISRGYGLAKYAKDKGYYTVMGGAHVSSVPDEPLRNKFCDAVVIGEGEKMFAELIETRASGIFKGEPIKDLNDVPMPAFDLINAEFYCNVRRRVQTSLYSFVELFDRVMSLMSSRGCPYKCKYCYNSSQMYETPARYKTAEKTVEEFWQAQNTYNLDAITFLDDDFVLNKPRLKKICELLADNKRVYWGCNSRVTDVNEEMLAMLKQAGCVQLAFGIESGNNRVAQEVLEKKATVEQAKEAVRLCHEYGIVVQSNFMFGAPTETEEEMMDTLRFMQENTIDGSLGASAVIPFPKTGLWQWCVDNKKFPDHLCWDDFNYSTYPINMSTVTKEKFKEIMAKVAKFQNENIVKTEPMRRKKVQDWKRSVGLI